MLEKIKNRIKFLNPKMVVFLSVILAVFIAIILIIVSKFTAPTKGKGDSLELERNHTDGVKIYVDDIYNGRTLIPDFNIKLNEYDNSLFSVNSHGYNTYPDAKIGIDISGYQNKDDKMIDWYAVKASGVDFAIIRLGYRGYTEGTLNMDRFFHDNIKGATEAGLDVGVYFFSQAISAKEAEEEAKFVLENIKDYEIKYPVAFDWETITHYEEGTVPRTDSVNLSELATFAEAFCKKIKDNGYVPSFYTNKYLAYNAFNLKKLEKYDMWYAEYQPLPSLYYDFEIWQWTESGVVPGIEGSVDINIAFKNYG